MIPGSNILNQAFSIIAKQELIYYRYVGRVINAVGQNVTTYARGTALLGSFQPVPRSLYQTLGLDLTKTYYTFYVSADLLDIERDITGDQLAFQGQRYQCESNNDWFNIDGWKGILCVRVGLDSGDVDVFGFGTNPSTNDYVNFERGNFLPSFT